MLTLDLPASLTPPSQRPRSTSARGWHARVALGCLAVAALCVLGCGRDRDTPSVKPGGGSGAGKTTATGGPGSPGANAGEGRLRAPGANAAKRPPGGSALTHPSLTTNARQLGAGLQAAGTPVDVLVRAPGPAWTATELDASLAPLTATLRKLQGVVRVWTRADDGGVRLLVRFDAKTTGADALARVRATWVARPPARLGTPTLAVIAQGQRALSAVTLIAAEGAKASTQLLARHVVTPASKLAHVAAASIVGAVRPYQVVQWMPPYLARHKVPLADAHWALVNALRAQPRTKGGLGALLERSRVAGGKVHLGELSVVVSGVGEPQRRALMGKRTLTVGLVEGGHAVALDTYGRTFVATVVNGTLKKTPKGTETFHHALSAMQRYRLTLPPDAPAESDRVFRARLDRLAKSGRFHDLLAVSGADGVPVAAQDDILNGRTWTLWVAAGAAVPQYETYEALLGALKPGGWQLTPLDAHDDTGLRWLLGVRASMAVTLSSADVHLLQSRMTALTREVARERRLIDRVTGPRKGPLSPQIRGLHRRQARAVGARADDVALALHLKDTAVLAGQGPGGPVWSGLPTGVMSQRQGELPLRATRGVVPLQQLLRVPEPETATARVRLNGMPTLWFGGSPKTDDTTVFAQAFWTAVEQHVAPSKRLEVRPLSLALSPLSRALARP